MASTNADSMTNAQGEFQPSRPRDEPMTTSGHQPGRITSEKDAAPEFTAKTLPAGTAPKANTFQPNPINEVPGQANNPDLARSHGKESVETSAESTLVGATSADVHTGLGHPGQGQTSTELRHDGQHTSKKAGAGLEGVGAQGGSGLRDDGNVEKRRLETEGDHPSGPKSGHNVSLDGAEDKMPVTDTEVASEGDKLKKQDYNRSGVKGTGNVDKH